jgi:hypothetical protein
MLPTLRLDLVSSRFKFSFSFFHPTPLGQLRRDAVPSRRPHSDDFNTTRTPPLRLYFDAFSEPRIDIFCLPNELTWCQSLRPFMSARSLSYHHPRVVVLWFLSRSFLAQVDAPSMPPRMVCSTYPNGLTWCQSFPGCTVRSPNILNFFPPPFVSPGITKHRC